MAVNGRARLRIDIEPELQRKIAEAAGESGMSVRDYVVATLQQALQADDTWTDLSARSFARDWNSNADRVYDELP